VRFTAKPIIRTPLKVTAQTATAPTTVTAATFSVLTALSQAIPTA